MSDPIDRQDAIDAAIEAADDWDGGCNKERDRFIRDALEELPSAQPEIIRCEDCANCQIDDVYHDYWCDGKKVWKDHFCGYAERKTDEQT